MPRRVARKRNPSAACIACGSRSFADRYRNQAAYSSGIEISVDKSGRAPDLAPKTRMRPTAGAAAYRWEDRLTPPALRRAAFGITSPRTGSSSLPCPRRPHALQASSMPWRRSVSGLAGPVPARTQSRCDAITARELASNGRLDPYIDDTYPLNSSRTPWTRTRTRPTRPASDRGVKKPPGTRPRRRGCFDR
jgi:hypothetical protein